jgi:uncharacterized protein
MRGVLLYSPRWLAVALALTALAAGPAAAGAFEDGVLAYKADDYATAARLWLPMAEAGNTGAQYNVGRLYYYGQGVVRDPVEACKWFLLAADRDNAEAKRALIMLYPMLTRDQIATATGRANDWRLAHPR